MSTKRIYCLSGLGADHRIFSNLQIAGCELIHLEWLMPQGRTELIDEYAKRVAAGIRDDFPILMGVSFGGMMAIEIAKYIPVRAVILISSVKNWRELPAWMKVLGRCRAEYLLPNVPLKSIKPLKVIRPVQNYFLGAHTVEQMAIANEFRDSVDPAYLKWSLRQIFNWRNAWAPERIFHIHGDNDKLFPISKVKPTHTVANGGHFMVMSHSTQINLIITEICSELEL